MALILTAILFFPWWLWLVLGALTFALSRVPTPPLTTMQTEDINMDEETRQAFARTRIPADSLGSLAYVAHWARASAVPHGTAHG